MDFDDLTAKIKKRIVKACTVYRNASVFNKEPEPLYCFSVDDVASQIHLPLGLWKEFFEERPLTVHPSVEISFSGSLYTKKTDPKGYRDQDVVSKKAITKLSEDGYCFLALATGFGKTTLGCYIISKIQKKTVILCHSDLVKQQWVDELKKFTTARVKIVQGVDAKLDDDIDVYVMGVVKATKYSRSTFEKIGLVIVDEAHMIVDTLYTKALLKFSPTYLLGLSATPKNRKDGSYRLIELYFGDLKKEAIWRKEVKNFVVVKCNTPFKPTLSYTTVKGETVRDWTSDMNSLAYNKDRNRFAADLVLRHPESKPMVLCGRVEQGNAIADHLDDAGESSQRLFGKGKKKRDPTKRIVVAGMKKAGVGFNDPDLNMQFIVFDAIDVAQFEGRIRVSNNIIYDLVDDDTTLENHWEKRKKWYLKRGATIKEEGEPHKCGSIQRKRVV